MNIKQYVIFGLSLYLSGCVSQTSPVITPAPIPNIESIDEFFNRCPTREEVAQVNADLEITIEYDPTAGVDVCHENDGSEDLSALQKRIYQTVYVMKLLKFSRPLPWTDLQLYDWLTTTIEGIRFVRGGISRCCEPENVVVIALHQDSMLLTTDQWVMDDSIHGLMDATLLYAHEARHNEGFLHACTTRNGDDNTLDEMGAWAISHYLALWIAQYGDRAFLAPQSGSPDLFREAALQRAEITRLTRFCKEIYAEPTITLAP